MVVPIICREPDCVSAGETINEVSGINPQDLDDFYERLGIAEDPLFEARVGAQIL